MTVATVLFVIRAAIASVFLHPIHISVTEIEFDEKDKALEIMMRVFIDDLELSFRNAYNQPDLDIFDRANHDTVDELMTRYLIDRFSVALDGKAVKYNYLGHEQEPDVFVFYIEVPNVKKWREISVRNTIIMETYDDQSNLVNVSAGGRIRSLRLTRDTPADKLTFDK